MALNRSGPFTAIALVVAACWASPGMAQTAGTEAVLPAAKGVLGVGLSDPPPPWQGALVQTEQPNGAAARAGLQVRDLVIAADSQPVRSAAELTPYVATRRAGDRLMLQVMRWNGRGFDGMEISATLDAPGGAPTGAAFSPGLPGRTAEPASGGAAEVAWTSFTDPYEQGFTVAVPQGWKVAGGVLRKSPLVPNAVVRMLAPDRSTFVAIGDPDNLDYAAPIPAAALAKRFAETVLAGFCPGLQVTGVADQPQIVQFAMAKSIDPTLRWSAAEATVVCRRGTQELAGKALAAFRYMPVLRSGHPQILAGFLTLPGQEQAAAGVLDHVLGSFQENPAWTARKDQLVDQLHQSALARWGQEQRQFQAVDQIISNSVPYVAPDGRRFDLDATHAYHWIGPNGVTAGTDVPSPPPGGGWTMLQRLPR